MVALLYSGYKQATNKLDRVESYVDCAVHYRPVKRALHSDCCYHEKISCLRSYLPTNKKYFNMTSAHK